MFFGWIYGIHFSPTLSIFLRTNTDGKRNFFKRIFHSIRNCKEIEISFHFYRAKVIFIIHCRREFFNGWTQCFSFFIPPTCSQPEIMLSSPFHPLLFSRNATSWMRKIRCVLWCCLWYFIVRNEKRIEPEWGDEKGEGACGECCVGRAWKRNKFRARC